MKSKTENQKIGHAEKTTNINPNNPSEIIMNKNDNNPTTLKKAAEMFGCADSTLKNNIKSGKLPATQEHDKAAYLVKPSDVKKFLEEQARIVSIFHPAQDKLEENLPSKSSESSEKKETPEDANQTTPSNAEKGLTEPQGCGDIPLNSASGSEHKDDADHLPPKNDEKTPRKRRRGKGGGKGARSAQHPTLKALACMSPQERLRITACLNELASIVASA